jgi:flagellar L-ring protein precursor FlgH
MTLKIVLFLFISFILVGCTNSTKNINNSVKIDEPPKYQIPKKVEQPKPKAKGSLFSNQGGSLFSDRKNLQVGDIVYVTIEEGPSEARTESTRDTSLNDDGKTQEGGSLNDVPGTSMPIVGSLIKNSANVLNKVLGMGYSLPSRSGTFSASSETEVLDAFSYNISAIVTQLYQNGNYLIQGTKEVVVNGQKQTLKLSGVLSPYDLGSNNVIESNKLANLKVKYYKNGEDQELMEKPWGTQIVETISPF